MSKKDTAFWESEKLNNRTYQMYYNRLLELAINTFEWKGLPPSIDPRFLELILFSDGMSVFFKDDILDYLALQVAIGGVLDVYRVPTMRRAYATNGYSLNLSEKDSVIIFNNYSRTNCLLDVEMYARRMYEIERTIDVNVKQQKTPCIVKCSEQQRLTMLNLFKNYEGNVPFIFGDKGLDLSGISTIKIDAPFVADSLQILKRQIWNEALTYLGIDNANTEKKERLVTDEVTSNLGGVQAQRYTRLNARRDAVEKINAMFGLNISVEFRGDTGTIDDETTDDGEEDENDE